MIHRRYRKQLLVTKVSLILSYNRKSSVLSTLSSRPRLLRNRDYIVTTLAQPRALFKLIMPTPESESFLRKKPTVPPTFEGVDLGNSEAVVNARDAIIREQWVQVMMARLVREEMGKCYHREGVNHLEKCGKYRGTVVGLLLDS